MEEGDETKEKMEEGDGQENVEDDGEGGRSSTTGPSTITVTKKRREAKK